MGRYRLLALSILVFLFTQGTMANAAQGVKLLPTIWDMNGHGLSTEAYLNVEGVVARYFNPAAFREVRAQLMRNNSGQADHIIVYLLRPGFHQVRTAVIYVDSNLNVSDVAMDYHIQKSDVFQERRRPGLASKCPDPSVQFIAFAPNDDDLEQQITVQVGQFAQSHGLKTIMLLKAQATSQNYLDYMSCPNLIGNFYDGDANPQEITTVDGSITYEEISTVLKGAFRLKVTNIWLACEAYNNPMLNSMIEVAQSQKYFAGINDLQVGPSDKTAACTMTAAIGGQPIMDSFNSCYKQYDNPADHWGGDGHGSNFLGK